MTFEMAKTIARAINSYAEKHTELDYNTLVIYVEKNVKCTRAEVSEVIEFLQELKPTEVHGTIEAESNIASRVAIFMKDQMDLGNELKYNYGVAKALLEIIMNRGNVPDSEEVRKTLREISRFGDAMLKMQERVYNVQQIQAFQTRVMEILEDMPVETRDVVLTKLLEADL